MSLCFNEAEKKWLIYKTGFLLSSDQLAAILMVHLMNLCNHKNWLHCISPIPCSPILCLPIPCLPIPYLPILCSPLSANQTPNNWHPIFLLCRELQKFITLDYDIRCTFVHRVIDDEPVCISRPRTNKLSVIGEYEIGELEIGENEIGEYGIGEYGLGEHGIGDYRLGEYGIGENGTGEHRIGEHEIGEHGIGKILRHLKTRLDEFGHRPLLDLYGLFCTVGKTGQLLSIMLSIR